MKNRIHYTRQQVMGYIQTEEPRTEEHTFLDFPDNSAVAEGLREQHPVVMAFEEKYSRRGINWRARFER